jgi:superfamily II DNA/RNA helicase
LPVWLWLRPHDSRAAPPQVGRTARAGRDGLVTSLYGEESAILAEAIKAAVDLGECPACELTTGRP